ncbi:MAG: hypothetical protein H7281_03500 [Bacteriovorax sp.]|nr:hypothetical protein [Bacteriovorax sp.]
MLSKILPWDFIQKYPKSIDPKQFGINAFLIDEPYLERVILDRLPKKELKFSLYSGSDVTRDFIEEHFVNLSFFGGGYPILIMNAETIPSSSLDFLCETDIDWSERVIVLFFTKSGKQFLPFAKNKKVQAIELELPRFWEGAKLWQFCQKARDINLDGTVTRFALENLEHNFESFFWLIDTIKMNFPEGIVNFKVLQELVTKERWDFFELIDLFHRAPKLFFVEILKKEIDYEWMRTLSLFMQSHITKILFPEELRSKGKLSKYDQTVLDMSEKLNRDIMKYYLGFFSELEILSKSSDLFLVNRLRLETLK